MEILRTLADLNAFRERPGTIALIPTMGALHAGHMALVQEGLKRADTAVVSIFVNPTQFAPHEDLDSYPRTLEADIAKLESEGVHAVWAPSSDVMYPNGTETDTHVSGVSEVLEGEYRPHFFDGVATIVRRLFDQVKPDIALFGEKDYQQLQVVKQIVTDYSLPVEIIGVPIVRGENGLALSSRNAYLDKAQIDIAAQLNKTLFAMAETLKAEKKITDIENWGKNQLLQAGFDKVDYCTIRDDQTLQPVESGNLRILAAAWLGKTRLIDNIAAS